MPVARAPPVGLAVVELSGHEDDGDELVDDSCRTPRRAALAAHDITPSSQGFPD